MMEPFKKHFADNLDSINTDAAVSFDVSTFRNLKLQLSLK